MMKVTRFWIMPLIFLICIMEMSGQDVRTVSGIVTSFKKAGLNKATIVARNSKEVTYSDSSGQFVIKCFDKDVLSVSASGFKSKKVSLGTENVYNIDLAFNNSPENFSKAVEGGHISADLLRQSLLEQEKKNARDFSKYSSIWELISCEVYEVSVKGNAVYNKSVRSFDSNPQVLYVVDDKIISDISYINPAYVRAIEFVDDVGASMYGSKGANGVLKIWLK